MNFSNQENSGNLAFLRTFQFLPNFRSEQGQILKIPMVKFRSRSTNVVYAKTIVS